MQPVEASALLQKQGFALVDSPSLRSWLGHVLTDVEPLLAAWDRLPPDLYLKDQGRYRFRRHASAQVDLVQNSTTLVPHRAHWQPTTYNALHGGIRRWFEPIEPTVWAQPALQALVLALGRVFGGVEQPASGCWYVEAHQFRIDARHGVGKPTPEGAHRDGVDFVAVVLLERTGIVGGETAVHTSEGDLLLQATLDAPWTALLMDDQRVKHETSPIVGTAPIAHRDTLVLTYRSGGFMTPD